MRLFGILLIFLILAASGGYVYLGTQDWKGRQQINAAGLRHLLILRGLPLEGKDFAPDDETDFAAPMAGGEFTRTVSKKLLESYFRDNSGGGSAPPAGADPAPAARAALATNAPVTNQVAEVKRVLGLLKAELDKVKDGPPAARVALVEGWVLLQAETLAERAEYQAWAAPGDANGVAKAPEQLAADADALAHALDKKFYRVAPKLYDSPDAALAPARWQELQKKVADAADPAAVARLRPPAATDEADRRARLAHLFVHLDRDAAWQKRTVAVVGLRRYVYAVATQAARFRDMREQVERPIPTDQATFQRHQDYLINEARQNVDRARAVADEKAKLIEQKSAADDAVSRRQTQLKDLTAQLQKVKTEVDELLVRQTGIEKQLYEVQREVALTLEEVYRLDALLTATERERYGISPPGK